MDKGRVVVVVVMVGRGMEECGERERERWSYEREDGWRVSY